MTFEKKRFKDLIDHKSGYTWSKEQELKVPEQGTIRVLTVSNIQNELDLNSELYLKGVTQKDKQNKAVSKNWAIAVSSNGNRKRIGNAVFIKEDTEYLFASFLTGFIPKNNSEVIPEYFFRWLTSYEIQEKISAVAEGTTELRNMSLRHLRNTYLEYPKNKEEQRIIAFILNHVDGAITATKTTIAKAERLKKGLIQNLLSGKLKPDLTWRRDNEFYKDEKFGNTPIGWHWGRLSEIANVIAGQSPAGEFYNEESKGVPMLNGPTEFTDLYPIPVQYTTKTTKLCEVGDILFTVRGSSTGRMNIADQKYCIGRGIAAIRNKEGSNIDFIYYTLITIAEKILAEAKGSGTTFPNVNRGELLKKWVLIPKDEQEPIVIKIKSIDTILQSKQAKVAKLEKLKKALMQNLLNGKVRVKVKEAVSG